MEKYFYSDQIDMIDAAEKDILFQYKKVLAIYAKKIRKYRATMNVFLGWKNSISNIVYNSHRPPITSGYMAFICCQILNPEGKIVESEDHDMYMDFAWMISVYENGLVFIEDKVDDDLSDQMRSIEEYFEDPY